MLINLINDTKNNNNPLRLKNKKALFIQQSFFIFEYLFTLIYISIKKNMNIILFDPQERTNLLPLSYTRPVSYLRTGILTIKEKWEHDLKQSVSVLTEDYLKVKYPTKIETQNLLINGSVLPDKNVLKEINALQPEEILMKNNCVIAYFADDINILKPEFVTHLKKCESQYEITQILYPWDIFRINGEEIKRDFFRITGGRKSQPLSKTVNALQTENIFLEKGAKIEFASLNPDGGYIYIGKEAEVMEGSLIRGSFALCEHSTVKLGAKIYGPTTVGPYSKCGGEVNNSVILGYSNKGHDGFLGNSVLGEWCNIGADSNNSNLKNNYAEVKVWNYNKKGFINTGLQFCGLIMGDHSKCGINTMFNTGTLVGVSANIFGSGFPRNFIPSFSWGGASGFTVYTLKKAFETAELVMNRRDIAFDDIEKAIFEEVFKRSEEFRR